MLPQKPESAAYKNPNDFSDKLELDRPSLPCPPRALWPQERGAGLAHVRLMLVAPGQVAGALPPASGLPSLLRLLVPCSGPSALLLCWDLVRGEAVHEGREWVWVCLELCFERSPLLLTPPPFPFYEVLASFS